MKQFQYLGLGLVLAIAGLTGCSPASSVKTNGTTSSADQIQATGALASAADLIDDSQISEDTSVGMATTTLAPNGALALVRPYRWWRNITHVDRQFAFAFSDTDSTGRPRRVDVTVTKTLWGTFNVVTGPATQDSLAPDSARTVVHKALEDHWVRHLLLERVPRPDSVTSRDSLMWRVAGTSGVSVLSDLPASGHVHIVSLRVQSGVLDTTITDPLAFFRLRRMVPLMDADSVRVTVTTENPDDIVLVVHNGHRWKLRPNGDGTFSGTGWIPDGVGVRHVGINAFARGTLFDDAAPYNSDEWIFPFVRRGESMPDYR